MSAKSTRMRWPSELSVSRSHRHGRQKQSSKEANVRLDVIMKYVNARMVVIEAVPQGGANVYEIKAQRDAHDELDKMLREDRGEEEGYGIPA